MNGQATVAHIQPAVLRWARDSAGYSLRQAADKIGVEKWYLELAESGGELLTLREAERAAEAYERPLAALFVPSPPDEEPQEVQFRRLPGTPEPPWGPEIQLVARKVTERQLTALDIYEVMEEPPPWLSYVEQFAAVESPDLAARTRKLLGVSRDEQHSWTQDTYAPLRAWRSAVEELGVLVMQDGPVPVDEMRGFASIEPHAVPAVLINNKDDPRARAFTLIHEFAHIVLAARGELTPGERTERWCEEFAGRVLMPADWLREEYVTASPAPSPLARVQEVASSFHVTPLAAAVRLARTEVAPRHEIEAVIKELRGRSFDDREDEGGGSYYVNQIARFGPAYLRLVFTALDAQAVTLPTASALLDGVRVKYFEPLRDRLEGRR